MSVRFIDVKNRSAILSFSVREDGGRPWWQCLDLHGKPFYVLSNLCGTCPAIFSRKKDLKDSLAAKKVSEALNSGSSPISASTVDAIASLLPNGKYLVNLLQLSPFYSRQHWREVDYHWSTRIGAKFKDGYLDESIFPIVPEKSLDKFRIDQYHASLIWGPAPIALSVSFLMQRCPGGLGSIFYVNHILLDGHHKMMAASWRGAPIHVLSFWPLDSGISDLNEKNAEEWMRLLYRDEEATSGAILD